MLHRESAPADRSEQGASHDRPKTEQGASGEGVAIWASDFQSSLRPVKWSSWKCGEDLQELNEESKSEWAGSLSALLDWLNTPTECIGTSPVQRLMGRRTRTLLPTHENLLNHPSHKDTATKLFDRKVVWSKVWGRHYCHNRRPLRLTPEMSPPLNPVTREPQPLEFNQNPREAETGPAPSEPRPHRVTTTGTEFQPQEMHPRWSDRRRLAPVWHQDYLGHKERL